MVEGLRDRSTLRSALWRASLLAFGWWALAEGDRAAFAFGVPVILAATCVSLALSPPARLPSRLRVIAIVRLVGFFLLGSLRSGWDIARRALSPRLPLSPVIVHHSTRLTGSAQIAFRSINALMPGTLSIDVLDDDIRIHALVDRGDDLRNELELLEAHIAQAARPSTPRDGEPHA